MTYETLEHNGMICIVNEWQTHFERPAQFRHYYPTGLKTKDYPEIVGKPAREWNGVFEVSRDFPHSPAQFRLVDDGSTKACFVETRAIKKPLWAKRWYQGEWKRY